jgi:hypothetical protein
MSKARKKKRVLALPDLEQSKAAVLNSPTSRSGPRRYDHAHHRFRGAVLLRAAPRIEAHHRPVIPNLSQNKSTLRQRSTCASLSCDGSRMRPPIPACSVRSVRQHESQSHYSSSRNRVQDSPGFLTHCTGIAQIQDLRRLSATSLQVIVNGTLVALSRVGLASGDTWS